MAEIVVFHHAQGLTDGVRAFAEEIRTAGHTVHLPDLYEGATFADLDSGVAHAESTGFDVIVERGVAAAASLPENLVYAGFSLGVLPAQKLTQTRPNARGALLYHESLPPETFGAPWPAGVPLQIHVSEGDEWADHEAAGALRDAVGAELYVYPGSAHLFADSSLESHQPESARRLMERTLEFLARLG